MCRVIRTMKQEDIEKVAAIEKSIFSIPWSAQSLLDAALTPDNVYLVCEEDGNIAGYCGMWTVLGEGNITNVAVSPEYRRCGIGRELMEELIQRGLDKNVSVFFLEVRVSNEAAKRLYQSVGFKSIGRRRNFYERPQEDADVMSRITGHE